MGSAGMAKTALLAVLLGVAAVLPGLRALDDAEIDADLELLDDGGGPDLLDAAAVSEPKSLGESYARRGANYRCLDAQKALGSICHLYGDDSKACKAVSEAAAAKEEAWGCATEMGESWGDSQKAAYAAAHKNLPAEPHHKTPLATCRNYNKDTAPKQVCDLAKKMCAVRRKDYCTARLQLECVKSIGIVCGAHDMYDPSVEKMLKKLLAGGGR